MLLLFSFLLCLLLSLVLLVSLVFRLLRPNNHAGKFSLMIDGVDLLLSVVRMMVLVGLGLLVRSERNFLGNELAQLEENRLELEDDFALYFLLPLCLFPLFSLTKRWV